MDTRGRKTLPEDVATGAGRPDGEAVDPAHAHRLFREVNERIVELSAGWPSDIEILWECAEIACSRTLLLSRTEYEFVREDPMCFVVVGRA